MGKKVIFNLDLNETIIIEKEKVDYYDDYLSSIEKYLSYGDNDKKNEEDNNLKNKGMILRNGKVKNVNNINILI